MPTTRPLSAFSRLLLRPNTLARPLTTTARLSADRHPSDQRDAQGDREKMNTQPNEYAKSGTDSAAAGNKEAAFERGNPKPEDAKAKAGEGNKVNPLDASPANQEISKGTSEVEGGGAKKMSEGGGGRKDGGDATGDKYGGSST